MLMKLSLGKGFYRHVRHLLSELAYATSRGFQRIYIVIRYICNGRDELLLVRSVVAAAASSIGRAGARPYRGAARYGVLASDHKLVEVGARIGNLALSSI